MSNGSDKYHLLMRKSKKSILKNCSKLIQYKDYFKDIMNSNYLVLVRHGQSEWNEKNLFTGWRDPGLTEKGVHEAHAAGKALKKKNIIFDLMFTSDLIRAQLTGEIILKEMDQVKIETIKDKSLNERASSTSSNTICADLKFLHNSKPIPTFWDPCPGNTAKIVIYKTILI